MCPLDFWMWFGGKTWQTYSCQMVLKNGDLPWYIICKKHYLKRNPRSNGCFAPLEISNLWPKCRFPVTHIWFLGHNGYNIYSTSKNQCTTKMGPLPVIMLFSWGLTPPVTTIDFRPWGLRAVYNSIKKGVRGRGSPWENITKFMFFPGKFLSVQLLYPSNWQFPNMF